MYTECRRQDDRNGSDGEDKKSIRDILHAGPSGGAVQAVGL